MAFGGSSRRFWVRFGGVQAFLVMVFFVAGVASARPMGLTPASDPDRIHLSRTVTKQRGGHYGKL